MKILNYLALGVLNSAVYSAFALPVSNGDFSNAANNGSIQGSLLSGGQLATPLGVGPWNAQTFSLAGLLVPALATIGGGTATISGLQGLGVAGQSNRGMFYQTLAGQSFTANTTYTLSVSLDSGVPLSLSLLGTNGIGIALTRGGNTNIVASSLTAIPGLISLTPLSGTAYQMSLQFATTSLPPVGDIGLQLFAGSNASLATASLLGDVTFDNVTLTTVPEPSSVGLAVAALAGLAVFRRRRRLLAPLAAFVASALLVGNAQAFLLNSQTLNVTLLPNSSYEVRLDLSTSAVSSLLNTLTGLQTDALQIVDANGTVLGSLPAQDLVDILNDVTGGLLGGLSGDLTHPVTIILETVNRVVDPILQTVNTPLLTVSNVTVTPVPTIAAGTKSDQAPQVRITKRQRANTNLKLGGTATDDQLVTRVEVTANGKMRKTTGTSSWKSKVKLHSGRNRIVVRAFDNAQRVSAPQRVTVVVK